MSFLQAIAMFLLGAASGAALIYAILKPAIDQVFEERAIIAPDQLVRQCVALIEAGGDPQATVWKILAYAFDYKALKP